MDTGTLEEFAKLAPLATALIALLAAATAVISILYQGRLARRRGAIDFFLKTEMDEDMVDLYNRFKKINVPGLRSIPSPGKYDQQDYKDARFFLNICELIAVGVNHGAFSETVAKAYWGNVIPDCYEKMYSFIRDVRSSNDEGSSTTYIDLEKIK